jgi:hypothetical protein
MSATDARYWTLHCDRDNCRARYKSMRGPISRAEVRREAAKDGWTHVHEAGMPRDQDQDFCANHKPSPEAAKRQEPEEG